MGYGGRPEGDEDVRAFPPSNSNSKGYKLHNKSFKNCDGVNHAAIPRKVRSAMDKRTHESLLPPSAKKHPLASNGIEQHQIAKKSKQTVGMQGVELEDSVKQATLDSITKDEEEVAQTLFALAKISSDRKTTWTELDEQIPSGMCSSPETKQNLPVTPQALEEESVKSPHSCAIVEPINMLHSLEETDEKSGKASSPPAALELLTIQQKNKIDLSLGSSTALAGYEKGSSSLACMSQRTDSPRLANATSSLQLTQHEASVCKQNPKGGLAQVTATLGGGQGKQQLVEDDSAHFICAEGLWPSLPMVLSSGNKVHDDSSRSSLTQPPAFLTSSNTATRSGSGSSATILLKEKVQQVKFTTGNSWKKCAAHVYISQLIKSYQTSERNYVGQIQHSNHNTLHEETNIKMDNCTSGRTEGVNKHNSVGIASSSNAVTLATESNGFFTENHFSNIPNKSKKMFQSREQLFSATSVMSKEKQNCNLPSILAHGGVVGPVAVTNNRDNKGGTGFESSLVHAPYMQPISQNNPIMPFSIPHDPYSSSPQVQLSLYVGSSSFAQQHPCHNSSLLQQQQQLWSAQYRPGGMPQTHIPKWRNGTMDSTIFRCFQSQPNQSSLSLSEVFGAKFSPVTEHQVLALSSPSSRGKMLHYRLPSSYPEGTTQLQLLCNGERL